MAIAARGFLAAVLTVVVAGCSNLPSPDEVAKDGGRTSVGADCGAGPLLTSTNLEDPLAVEAREFIESFIADFHRVWKRAGQPGDDLDAGKSAGQQRNEFEAWKEALVPLEEKYLVGGASLGEEGALSSSSSHDPKREQVTAVAVTGDTASVRTLLDPAHQSKSYYEFRLARVAGQWRIARRLMTIHPPAEPLMKPTDHEALLAKVPDDTKASAGSGRSRDELAALFAAPHTVAQLGSIETSGILTVHDFGWVQFDLAPFKQRIPAGSYRVSVARDGDDVNLALRARIAERRPTRWVDADRVGFDNEISVDAGNVALLDFATMPTCRSEWIEELYQDRIAQDRSPSGTVFSVMGETDDAVFLTSGYGDGGYPAYWGVAADGTITDLVVDFLVRR